MKVVKKETPKEETKFIVEDIDDLKEDVTWLAEDILDLEDDFWFLVIWNIVLSVLFALSIYDVL